MGISPDVTIVDMHSKGGIHKKHVYIISIYIQ